MFELVQMFVDCRWFDTNVFSLIPRSNCFIVTFPKLCKSNHIIFVPTELLMHEYGM